MIVRLQRAQLRHRERSIVVSDKIRQTEERLLLNTDRRIKVINPQEFPWSTNGRLDLVSHIYEHGRYKIWVGSGFLIGKNKVLTAGHNLYDSDPNIYGGANGRPKFVMFYPGKTGKSILYKSRAVSEDEGLIVHPQYQKAQDQVHDMGLVILRHNIGEKIGWVGIRALQDHEISGQKVRVTGYPGEIIPPFMYYMEGPVCRITSDTIHYHVDTTPGQSGSGVTIVSDEEHECIGVHVRGYNENPINGNEATRITKEKFNWLKALGL